MFGDACWARKILQVLLGRFDHAVVRAQHRPRAFTRGQSQTAVPGRIPPHGCGRHAPHRNDPR